MSYLKEQWKQTGEDVSHALKSLTKSIVKSVKFGVQKLNDWANEDNVSREEDKYNS